MHYKMEVQAAFSASHHLPGYQGLCSRVHGHRWEVEARLVWEVDEMPGDGMLVDFGEVERVLVLFDHDDVNQYIKMPTAENIASWMVEQLRKVVQGRERQSNGTLRCIYISITIHEDPSSSITTVWTPEEPNDFSEQRQQRAELWHELRSWLELLRAAETAERVVAAMMKEEASDEE